MRHTDKAITNNQTSKHASARKTLGVFTVLCALTSLSGCDMIKDLPIGNGYAAKNICSGFFISQIEPERLIDQYIAPQIEPLPLLLTIDIDEEARIVHVEDKIFKKTFAADAYYREGFGCTLLHSATPEELDNQLPPLLSYSLPQQLDWPLGSAGPNRNLSQIEYGSIDAAIDAAFEENEKQTRNTMAIAVIYGDQLIAEKYASGIDKNTPFIGWSMSKSFTSTLIGLLQDRRLIDIEQPAAVPEWHNTPSAGITIKHLLHMASGKEWFEESRGPNHDQGFILHRTEDFAGFYIKQPQAAEPGTTYNYSTGSTSLLARLAQDTLGGSLSDTYYFMQDALFQKINITSAELEYDTAGQPAGGSYLWLTARDWARLGLLYLNRGDWFGNQVLSEEWIDFALAPSSSNPEYGAQIWLNTQQRIWPSLPENSFGFLGHQEQRVIVVPDYQLVVVRLGFTFEGGVDDTENLIRSIIQALPQTAATLLE